MVYIFCIMVACYMLTTHKKVRMARLFMMSCLWALLFFSSSLELLSPVVLQVDMYEETRHQAGGPTRLYHDVANEVSCLLLL